MPPEFTTLNRLTDGIKPGKLILIGDQPSADKGAFITKMACHIASHNIPCAILPQKTTQLALSMVREKAHELTSKHNVRCIIIDNIHLMSTDRFNYAPQQRMRKELSNGLKSVAQELNISIVAIFQTNGLQEKHNHQPTITDIMEYPMVRTADAVYFAHKNV